MQYVATLIQYNAYVIILYGHISAIVVLQVFISLTSNTNVYMCHADCDIIVRIMSNVVDFNIQT